MKVILQKDIEKLGDAGDIKEVACGYARNFLIPQKLAILADESSKKAVLHQQKLIKLKKEKRKKLNQKIADSFAGLNLVMKVQVGEEGKLFGSVTSMDIAKKLRENGFEIEKKRIELQHPIKQTGEYEVTIKLQEGLNPSVKITVESE